VNDSAKSVSLGNVAILGVGLIGGSLAAGLKKAGCVDRVWGFGRSQANLDKAIDLGLVDYASTALETVVKDADVIVIASPVGAIDGLLAQLKWHAPARAVISDVASTKTSVIQWARSALGDQFPYFVPAHPIAGSEKSGPSAAHPELFVDHWTVLTPVDETDPEALKQVADMWTTVGARLKTMHPEAHDRSLGMISHLPHVTAYALMAQLARQDGLDDLLDMAAGGFLDITRIASSDPVMWRDIFLDNEREVLSLIEEHKEILSDLQSLISAKDSAGLEAWFIKAKRLRDRLAGGKATP